MIKPSFETYLVGGAVRDRLLDTPPKARDWVVVGADGPTLEAAGFAPVLGSSVAFLHPDTGERYTLACREEALPGARPRLVAASDVSLDEDLGRRDLTINAMAMTRLGELIDPLNGREDLDEGLLRHVSSRFVDDPLRLLRIARFAAQFGHWGFRVAHGTYGLLKKMAMDDRLSILTPDDIRRETMTALASASPARYFAVLSRCGALDHLFPELAPFLDPAAGHGSHADRAGGGLLEALDEAGRQTDDPAQRLAAWRRSLPAAAAAALTDRLPLHREQLGG